MRRGWAAICDRCGFEYKSYELKKEWTGLMTCHPCWEPRHPQDFIRAVADKQVVPWSRPPPEDVFVGVCYIDGLSGYAGFGVAGCMIAGNDTYSAAFLRDFKGI
jgi:hypothetical protein